MKTLKKSMEWTKIEFDVYSVYHVVSLYFLLNVFWLDCCNMPSFESIYKYLSLYLLELNSNFKCLSRFIQMFLPVPVTFVNENCVESRI